MLGGPMSSRTTKRSIPPIPSRRTTRREITPIVDVDAELTQFGPLPVREDDEPEPAASARPTQRDIAVPVAVPRTRSRSRGPRGEFSIPSARRVPTDAVAGSIDIVERGPRRRRVTSPPVEVHLASVTKRDITVIVQGEPLTLARHDALALAQIILTALA